MPLTRSAVSAGAKFPHFRLEGLGVITFYCKLYGLHINFNFPQYYLRPNNTRRKKNLLTDKFVSDVNLSP